MSEFRRRLMMVGKALPYDAEVEYIESNGTQYIDTGFYPNQNTRTILDMSLITTLGAGGKAMWGCRTGNFVNQFYFMPVVNKNKSRWSFGNKSQETLYSLTRSGRYIFDADKNVLNISGEGTRAYSVTTSAFSCDYSFAIFAINSVEVGLYPGTLRLHGCQIFDNGTLVKDYIPVRVGNVGYLYDKVSETLIGNAGTGNFIIGNDVNT